MVAIVVDEEVIEALRDMKAWVDKIPHQSLQGLRLPDLSFDWIDTVIKNNDGSDFAYKVGDGVELLSSFTEDEFGLTFSPGMIGKFCFLLNGIYCVIKMDSALADKTGGYGGVECICKLTDIKLERFNST